MYSIFPTAIVRTAFVKQLAKEKMLLATMSQWDYSCTGSAAGLDIALPSAGRWDWCS